MQVRYDFLQTDEQIMEGLKYFITAPLIAIDTETTGLDPHTDTLLLIQMSNGEYIIIIDMTTDNALTRKDTESPVWKMMHAVLAGNALKIGHNIGFDFKMLLAAFGYEMVNMYCTMLAERVLTSGKDIVNKYPSLKSIVPKYTTWTEKEMKKEIREDFYMGYVLNGFTTEQLDYSARDVVVLHPIYYAQMEQLQKDNMSQVAGLEFSIIAPISLMEYYGVNIDTVYWRKTLLEVEEERVKVRAEVQAYLRPLEKQKSLFDDFCGISVDSPSQLLKALQDLGIDVESTGKNVLDKLKGDHPILKPLLQYRKLNKLMTSYGDSLLAKINRITGRVHGNFKQIGADTGRMSSDNPNLQNIPGQSKFRKGFIAPKRYVCLGADFGGQELRVLAFLSGDRTMREAFQNDEDLHTKTASGIFGIPYSVMETALQSLDKKKDEQRFSEITTEEEMMKAKRAIAKSANFLISYGGSYLRLAAVADIPEDEAKKIINDYFALYPGLKAYIDNEGNKAIAQGYSSTLLGRRRYYSLPSPMDPDYKKIESAIRRQAVNHTIQGASGDMTKLAVYYVHKAFCEKFGNRDAYIWAAVHDEIQTMVKEELVEEATKVLVEAMTQAFHAFVPREICPCKVDAKHGPFWIH
jgi:DNA polymerase I